MKKIKFMVIAAILSLACVLGFVACNNGAQTVPTEPMTITLNKTTLDIERHEEFTLTATVNNGSGTVYWSVDGTAVVCSDGVVRGVSAGTATVKATCGEASATCAVTVTDTGDAPLLTVDRTSLQLQIDTVLTVTAQTTYKGKPVTTGALTWVSEDPELVTVTPVSGTNSAEIKTAGSGVGETYVTVSGSYNGVNVSERIKVEVVKNVVVQISDLPLSDGVYHAELITSTSVSGMDATDLTTELQAVAEVYENGEKIEDPAVAWTSSDETVVKCEDGKLTAQGFGVATVTANYTSDAVEYSAEILVNVVRPTVRLQTSVDVELSGTNANKITLGTQLESNDSILSVKANTLELFVSKSGNTATLNADALSTLNLGASEFTVVASTVEYVQPVCLVTRKISDKATMDEVFHPQGGVTQSALNGYYVLGADIEYNAKWETIGEYKNDDWSLKFNGTLDGRGFAVKGVTIDSKDSGLFAGVSPSGIIKNLVFTDATLGGSGPSDYCYGGFICAHNFGTISDIYWQGTIEKIGVIWDGSYYSAPLALFNKSGGIIKNCFTDVTVGELSQIQNVCGAVGKNEGGTISNVYSVGYVSENSAVTGYSDFGAFVQANPNFSLDGWNTDMWEMQGNVPMPKGVTVPDVEAKITNTESTISQNGNLTITTQYPKYTTLSLKEEIDGVTLVGNILSIDNTVATGTTVTVVATNVFDGGETEAKPFTVVGGQTLTETAVTDLEIYGTDNKTVTFSDATKTAIKGNLATVTMNGSAITGCSYADGILTLANFGSVTGETEFVATFEEKSGDIVTYITTVNFKAIVITRIISDKTALDEVFHPEGSITTTGYYVLANEIDYNNENFAPVGGNWNGATYDSPFTGTLDGRGFAIKNIKMCADDSGIFRNNSGTIKNLAFTDVDFGGTFTGGNGITNGAFLAIHNFGTIENIYVQGKMHDIGVTWNAPTCVIVRDNGPTGVVSRCFVDMTVEGGNITNVGGGIGSNNGGIFSDVYCIGTKIEGVTPVSSATEYTTADELKAASIDFTKWEGDFWTVENGLPIPKTLATDV